MSRSKRRGHLHAVPDVGPSAAGSGAPPGRTRRTGRPADGPVASDAADWLGLTGDGGPPFAGWGSAHETSERSGRAPESPVDDTLRQLAALGLPHDLLDDGHAGADEYHAELAGLLRAATAMLAGDPVAGLLALWAPLVDPTTTVLDAEFLAAEILWSFNGAMGDDDLVDGLTRLVEEAAPTGRPEALAMCRMLAHLGPPEIRGLTLRTAGRLAAGGLTDRPWVSALGTAAFRRAYGFTDGPDRVVVVEFSYGRRPHAFVVVVDDHGGGLVGLSATEEVDELARQVRVGSVGRAMAMVDVSAAEAAARIRSALLLPLCPEDQSDEADMESLLPIVHERLGRLTAAPGPPPAQRR